MSELISKLAQKISDALKKLDPDNAMRKSNIKFDTVNHQFFLIETKSGIKKLLILGFVQVCLYGVNISKRKEGL